MADTNGSKPPASPAPAPSGAVVAEPALAPLRKVPAKVVSPMDRLKAYLKEVPSIRARLVKVTDEQEENLKRAKASIDGFDQATARINDIVKSWEEGQKDAGHHAAPAAGTGGAAPEPVASGVVPAGGEPRR